MSSLKFRDDGTFSIVQFTDIHWNNGEVEDVKTRAMMEMVVDQARPDLVALTGDTISGWKCQDPRNSLMQAVELLEERRIPWAFVFGNHDSEGKVTREELMETIEPCEMNLSEPGPEEISGVGNYALQIMSSNGDGTGAVLYFMDSGRHPPTEIGGYDWIRRDQIEWYVRESRRNRDETGRVLPSLVFFHIPIPEYEEVWDHHTCYGVKHEPVCCPRVNTGLFAAMHEMGDVIGVFVGHDHINDFEGDLHGIRLCYCRGTGFNAYGKEGFPRGARVIQLVEGKNCLDTWQVLSDGSTLSRFPEHAPAGRVLTGE